LERLLVRQDVQPEFTWDLESVYPTNEAWEQDYHKVTALIPGLEGFRGKLGESGSVLLAALKVRDEIYKLLWQVAVYAGMRRDENTADNTYQAMSDRSMSLSVRVRSAGSYMTPEILALPTEKLFGFIGQEPELQTYRHELEDLVREKDHVRSQEIEELLAQGSEVGAAPNQIFSMFAHADLKFPKVSDEHGEEVDLTEGRFARFRESPDRSVRENSFRTLFGTYAKFRNSLAAMHGNSVKKDVFYARARRYPSARAASLSGNNIPEVVYDNLVSTVNKNLPALHRYVKLRKRLLGLDELHMWDLYPPMVAEVDKKIPYAEAVQTVLKALEPLGADYTQIAREGLSAGRWVDVYENEGKRSGAYSGGSYTTKPFILLNYQENLDSMFTLAHELGHSMHHYLYRKHQPFHYGSSTIFVAEVASTFNEALLTDYLLKTTQDKKLRMYLINHSLESFRATLYRQTMFAEFEHLTHQMAEANEALTAEALCALYYGLNQKYYETEGMVVDKEIEIEWARIPHFYTPFYVYQYATGISAAASLSQQVLREGQPAVQRYLEFLKKGDCEYSIDLLKGAGVDMSSPEPVQEALNVFSHMIDEMQAQVS